MISKTHSRLFLEATFKGLRHSVVQLIYDCLEVCGGSVVNSLPSMMTWTCKKKKKKKGARSEPAEMGVPFSDHSAI